MSNGKLKVVNGKYVGEIQSMRMNFSFYLQEVESFDRRSEKSPSHKIIAKAPAGHYCQVGVAWLLQIKTGNSAGKQMFSLTLNDPEFGDDPVYVSAFPSGDGWELVIDRKRGSSVSSSPSNDSSLPEGEHQGSGGVPAYSL